MYRRLLIICLLMPLATAVADVPAPYDHGDPTAEEQVVLERINAIRAAPDDFATQYGYAKGFYDSRQPVVMNAKLLAAARDYADRIVADKWFSHLSEDGASYANQRLLDAGYDLSGDHTQLNAPNLGTGNTVENIAGRTPPDVLANFDFLMTSEGHRKNILSRDRPYVDQGGIRALVLPKWVEIWDPAPGIERNRKFQLIHVQEFAKDNDPTPHLLGVVYEDRNGNGKYDIGEGLPGVTVATTTGGYTATTATAGGYGIRVGVAGTYTLRASGGPLPEPIDEQVTIGDENKKVDFTVDLPETFDLVKSTIKIDFKKRLKGKTDVDSLKVKLEVDPDRLPENLHGVTAMLTFGPLDFGGPFTLTGNEKKGKFKTLSGVVPKIKFEIKRKSGKVVFEVKKADLMDDLGIANETATGNRSYDVTLTIGSAFGAPGSITHVYTSTLDKKAKFTAQP